MDRSKIAIGIGTIAGLLGGVAGVAAPFIAELADVSEPLGVDPKVWLVTGAALTFATIVGRMGQAIAVIVKGGPPA